MTFSLPSPSSDLKVPKTVSECSSIPSLTPVSHTTTKWCREKQHTARVSSTGSLFSTVLSHTNIILDLILSAPESNKKRSFMMFGNYREFDYINKVTWFWAQFFKRWITLSQGKTTIRWTSGRETSYAIQRIVACLADRIVTLGVLSLRRVPRSIFG